ncbi:MAG: hypothetical protein IT557_16095 [Alphaproteobacteria bacterium]|nr:hypothetical protein [Alphaproteobacteria bacterium]
MATALVLGAGAAQARIDQHQPGAETEALCQRVLALENFLPEVSVVRPRERLVYRLRLPVQIRQPAWRIVDELFVPEAPEGRVRYLFAAEIDLDNSGKPVPVLRVEDAFRHALAGQEAVAAHLIRLKPEAWPSLRAALPDDEDAQHEALWQAVRAALRASGVAAQPAPPPDEPGSAAPAAPATTIAAAAAALGAELVRLPVGPFAAVLGAGNATYLLGWGGPSMNDPNHVAATLFRLAAGGPPVALCSLLPPRLRVVARQITDEPRTACPVGRRAAEGARPVTLRPLAQAGDGPAGERLMGAAAAMIELPALGARAFALWQRRTGQNAVWPVEELLSIAPLPTDVAAGIERRLAAGDRALLTLAAPHEESDTPIAEPLIHDVEAPIGGRAGTARLIDLSQREDGGIVMLSTKRRARAGEEPANESHHVTAFQLVATGLPSAPLAWRRLCTLAYRYEHGPEGIASPAPAVPRRRRAPPAGGGAGAGGG